MGPVWQNPIQRTVRTAHLSVLMTVHSFSHTIQHRTVLIISPLTSRHTGDAETLQVFYSFFFLSFSFFHCPTEFFTGFSYLETSAIDLKFSHNVQNGLNSQSSVYFRPKIKKITAVLVLQPDTACETPGWSETWGDARTLQRGSLHTGIACSAAGPGPADTWDRKKL